MEELHLTVTFEGCSTDWAIAQWLKNSFLHPDWIGCSNSLGTLVATSMSLNLDACQTCEDCIELSVVVSVCEVLSWEKIWGRFESHLAEADSLFFSIRSRTKAAVLEAWLLTWGDFSEHKMWQYSFWSNYGARAYHLTRLICQCSRFMDLLITQCNPRYPHFTLCLQHLME